MRTDNHITSVPGRIIHACTYPFRAVWHACRYVVTKVVVNPVKGFFGGRQAKRHTPKTEISERGVRPLQFVKPGHIPAACSDEAKGSEKRGRKGGRPTRPGTKTRAKTTAKTTAKTIRHQETRRSASESAKQHDSCEPKVSDSRQTRLDAGQKTRLFTEMQRVAPKLERAVFDSFIDHLEPGYIYSRRLPQFIDQFRTFHRMQKILAGTKSLTFHHFCMMCNSNLLSMQEMNNILDGDQSISLFAAEGVLLRLGQIEKQNELHGPALSTWGDTCWINTAIQGMWRSVSSEMLEQLERKPHRDQTINNLQQSFCALIRAGHQALKEGRGVMLTGLQVEFIEACMACAREEKLGTMNDLLNKHRISEISQSSSSSFIDTIFGVLKLHQNESCALHNYNEEEAEIFGIPVRRVRYEDTSATINCAVPTEKDPDKIRMYDWITSHNETRTLTWDDDDQPHEVRMVSSGAEVKVETRRTKVPRVNTEKFKVLRISMGDVDLRNLAKQAILRDGQEFVFPAANERGEKVNMRLKLSAIALHAGKDIVEEHDLVNNIDIHARSKKTGGHYLLIDCASPKGVMACDDFRHMEFADYARMYGHGAGTHEEWNEWQDMLRNSNYAPAYCYYDVVGFESAQQ